MTSTSSDGSSVITLQFALDLNIDVAEQEVQQSINASGTYLPADLPAPPIYSKTNPGRRADPDAGADLERAAAVQGGGSGRHAAGPEDLAVARRGSGEHQRRAEARRAHPGQSDGAGLLRPESGRPAHRDRRGQRQPGQGEFRRPAAGLQIGANDQLLIERRLSRRWSSPTATARRCSCQRRGHGDGRRGEHPAGGLDERRPRR